MRIFLRHLALVVDLGETYRCLSSAVLGGGLSRMRTWINQQVPPGYSRTDPREHLLECAHDLEPPVVGMLTAAPVSAYCDCAHGSARAVATVGLTHPLSAAGRRPVAVPRAGTINVLVAVLERLSDEGLAGALQTATEAKVQALAEARIPALNADVFATGTATDSFCIACPEGQGSPFAGTATRVGGDIAQAVHGALLEGALRYRAPAPEAMGGRC